MKLSLCLLFQFISFNAFTQNALKSDTSTLQITQFHTRIGVYRKDSVWNINKEIRLPSQPTFISVTVNEKTPNPKLICILQEEYKIYDTIQVGQNNTVNIFNLSGGNYDLTFVNKNNQNRIKVSFIIEPVFWEKWWFIPFVFLIISAIMGFTFYFFYLIRLRQQLRTQLIRDNIARDLHDEVGSTLSSISMLSTSVKIAMENDQVRSKKLIESIGTNAQKMLESMDDIVWAINPKDDSFENMMVRMREYAYGITDAKNISVDFKVDSQVSSTKISMQIRRNIYLIFKESINNLVKHSGCTMADITFKINRKVLIMTILDNGNGFDTEKQSNRNGLRNMTQRAKEIGGKFEIKSTIGEGTAVNFELPIA